MEDMCGSTSYGAVRTGSPEVEIVGRETLAAIDELVVDLTVQMADRVRRNSTPNGQFEPPDKKIVQLRVDVRGDGPTPPIVISMEAGSARQLLAVLRAAADIADDLRALSGQPF